MLDSTLTETRGCLCLAARRAARTITREFDRALRPHGLRSTQPSALAMLTLAGETTVGDVAAMLGAERTTMTRNLRVLEERGLLAIRRGEDARVRVATTAPSEPPGWPLVRGAKPVPSLWRLTAVTDHGRDAIAAALPAWRDAQTRLEASLGTESAGALRSLAWSETTEGTHRSRDQPRGVGVVSGPL